MSTSPTPLLTVEVREHVAVITIDNPPANTWNAQSLNGLVTLLDNLEADREVYALVITGRGEKFFSAGADLKMFADGDKAVAATLAMAFGRAFERLSAFRGVTIAALNGFAMGGGLECALACDVRIAEQQAVMALPEATVGLLPCGGGTQNLAWLVGEGWAKRMILCGERVDADTAARIGLVEEVVEQGQALGRALELAGKVASQSPSSVAVCKQLIQTGRRGNITQALAREREAFVGLFDTADQAEGVQAFLGKRKPVWQNR